MDMRLIDANNLRVPNDAPYKASVKRVVEQQPTVYDAKEVEVALKFKAYFDELYGKGLEVANYHLNGDLEPFDNFYESALDEASVLADA